MTIGWRHFQIAHEWDGTALVSGQRAALSLRRTSQGIALRFQLPFFGDEPPNAPVGSTDKLWEHEVFEVFIVGADGAYTELEFGPQGHYLGLILSAPRVCVQSGIALDYVAFIEGSRWFGQVVVRAEDLPEEPWRLNAFAIHCHDPRCYWAMTPLPGEAPDFHQPKAFKRRLAL